MKTTIDAVNEFKGEWPYHGYEVRIIHSSKINTSHDCFSDYYGTGINSEPNSSWYLVCNESEFNQCVEDCSNNFGNKAKPVYTKEFRVLGGTNEVWQKCKIVFTGKRYTVVENENGKEFSRKTAKIMIRDVDTRTDEEKAIHEACLIIDDSKRCVNTNINIDCSAAQKAVVITLIKNGWSK